MSGDQFLKAWADVSGNLYAARWNDPVNGIDPDGLWGIRIGGIKIGWGDPTYDFGGVDWGGYWGDVGSTALGEVKGAGANLSFGLYSPCYRNQQQKQGGLVGQGLAVAGETLAGGAGLLKGAGGAGLEELGEQGLKDFAEERYLQMIGKKALSDAKYAKYFDPDPAQMGRNIIAGEGKLRALLPDPTANFPEAMKKGLTPGARMLAGALGLAAAARNSANPAVGGGGCQ
jgi:hypothetical protein